MAPFTKQQGLRYMMNVFLLMDATRETRRLLGVSCFLYIFYCSNGVCGYLTQEKLTTEKVSSFSFALFYDFSSFLVSVIF